MGASLSYSGQSSKSLQARLDKALDARGKRRPADEMFSIRFKEPFGDFDLLRSTGSQGFAAPVFIVTESRKTRDPDRPVRLLERVCYPKSNYFTVQECIQTQTGQEPRYLPRVVGKTSASRRTTVYYDHCNLGSVASQLRRRRPGHGRPVSIPTAIAIRLVRQVLEAIQTLHPADDRLDAFEHGHVSTERIVGHVDSDGKVGFKLSGMDGARQFRGTAAANANNLNARLAAGAADKSKVLIVVQELIALSYSEPSHLPDLQVLKGIETDLTALLNLDPDVDVGRDMRWLTDKLRDLEKRYERSGRQHAQVDAGMILFSDICREFVREQERTGGDLFWRSRDEVNAWAHANLNPADSWTVVWWSKESVDPVNGVEIPQR